MARNGKRETDIERREWIESLDYVLERGTPGRFRWNAMAVVRAYNNLIREGVSSVDM